MTTTAFPVRQTEAGVGCTDIAMRKIFGAQKYQYEGWRATRVWDRGVAD